MYYLYIMKTKTIKLDCGVEVEEYGKHNVELDITDLFNGYGKFNDLPKFIEVLTELNSKGYRPCGMSREEGIYGGIDKLTIHFNNKKIK